MNLFVSYARENQEAVHALAARIEQLGHDAWLDRTLAGGQAWWDEILAQIRACDAFLIAVSDASLESEACTSERRYARALGKPLLPVAVDGVRASLLPRELASIQLVDYSAPGEDAAIELAKAVSRLAPAPPVPDPLPEPPPVPVSYVSDLGQRVAAPALTRDEQVDLVDDLEQALHRARKRKTRDDFDAILHLLDELEDRPDLFAAVDRRIQAVREKAGTWREEPQRRDDRPREEPERNATPPPPKLKRRSKAVTILAIIGAVFVILILIGLSQSPEPDCFVDPIGNVVCP